MAVNPDTVEPEPALKRYDLFLSHSHGDADQIVGLAEQIEDLAVSVFLDQWDITPGKSSVVAMEEAMAGSAAVAVFVGANGLGRWHSEEMRQALRRSVDAGVRSFIVWLPGAPAEPAGLPELAWIRERSWIDLRTRIDENGRVDDEGLAELVAGALGMTPRNARRWLVDRRSHGGL